MDKFEEVRKQVKDSRIAGMSDDLIIQGLKDVNYNEADIKQIMDNDNLNNSILVNNDKEKNFPFKKILISVVVLLIAGAVSVFGYAQVNPFFLKSEEDILRDTVLNTYERMIQGNFTFNAYVKNQTELDGQEYAVFELPISFSISEITEGNIPDTHTIIGDFDITGMLNPLVGEFGFGLNSLDNVLRVEFKTVDENVYINIVKIPNIVSMFLTNVNLLDKYKNKWIVVDKEFIELESGELSDYSLESSLGITTEEKDYIINRIIQAILVDANPVINSKRINDAIEIDYSADLMSISRAIEVAIDDISQKIEPLSYGMGDFNYEEYDKTNGMFVQKIVINDSFLIENLETKITYEDGGYKGEMITRLDYDFSESVIIEKPFSEIEVEDALADFSSLFFGEYVSEQDDHYFLIDEGYEDILQDESQ